MKIKAYVSMDENTKTHYYKMFDVITELPEVENLEVLKNNTGLTSWLDNKKCVDVEDVMLDCEQGNYDVYDYNFYKLTMVDIADYHNDEDDDKDINDFIEFKRVCILKDKELSI